MRVLVALVLVVSALAGCMQEPLASTSTLDTPSMVPRFDLNTSVLERLSTSAADGTMLDLGVWRPDTDEKVPVIVDIGPYFGLDGDLMEYTAIDMRLAEYFVPRGYAVARASVRGTGESEGCFDLGGPTEMQDVADMVDFLGEQEWSNGNVAAFGKSYDGTTPWMAAVAGAEHLRTIVPISGITDWYRYMFYDGVTYPEELAFNTYYYLYVDDEISIPGPDGGDPGIHDDDAAHHVTKNVLRACDGLLPQTIPQTQSTLAGDHDLPFWIERDYELSWEKVDVPVFMVHGLQDWNVKPDNQLPMYNALDTPKALWAGQWNHDYPDINRYNPDWSRHDWNETLLVWFDHWLKDIDNDWDALQHAEIQDQTGVWRNWTQWPPAEVREATLDIGSGAFGGPMAAVHEFATPPLMEDVLLSGQPIVDITLSVDRPLGHVTVKLLDEAPDGTRTELDHGARDVRHRDGRETGAPASPGSAFDTNVTLYPQELFLAKGHKLVLVLAAEDGDWWVQSPDAFASYTLDAGTLRLPVSIGQLAFDEPEEKSYRRSGFDGSLPPGIPEKAALG